MGERGRTRFTSAALRLHHALVLRGAAPKEYADPAVFFANTHPTAGLRNLLANVCTRAHLNKQARCARSPCGTTTPGYDLRGKCYGLRRGYLALHGEEELRPVRAGGW